MWVKEMSLQDDIDADVAAIMTALNTAQGAELADTATVDMSQVRAAFVAMQDQINALEARIADLESGGPSPQGPPEVEDASVDLGGFKTASEATTDAASRMADLLISRSNYDGSEQ